MQVAIVSSGEKPFLICPICQGRQIVKSGKHYLKFNKVSQRYQCKECGTTFCKSGYFKGKFPLPIVHHAITLYSSGSSLEKIQTEIKEKFNRNISRHGILRWLKKAEIPRRPQKFSGDQKHKKVRSQIELSTSILVRFTSSEQPEKLLMLYESIEKPFLLKVKHNV